MKKPEKTNVMRLLEQKKVHYDTYEYSNDGTLTGTDIAGILGKDANQMFKTLVLVGHSKTDYVFMVPVNRELSLKKAASLVGEKSIEMLKSKDLLPLTGYIHGGCSPIGMKKQFRTVLHESALSFETIIFSAGKIGHQVEVTPADLHLMVPYETGDVVED